MCNCSSGRDLEQHYPPPYPSHTPLIMSSQVSLTRLSDSPPIVIKHPMDLQTMGKKVRTRQYSTKKQFSDDLYLIWENCLIYNSDPVCGQLPHKPGNVVLTHSVLLRTEPCSPAICQKHEDADRPCPRSHPRSKRTNNGEPH